MENWASVMESGGMVDVIYFYFQKDFDQVPHGRLLQYRPEVTLRSLASAQIQATTRHDA